VATSANFGASEDEIHENWSLSGSIPICSRRFLRRANFLLA
jgi:hypothetical protein